MSPRKQTLWYCFDRETHQTPRWSGSAGKNSYLYLEGKEKIDMLRNVGVNWNFGVNNRYKLSTCGSIENPDRTTLIVVLDKHDISAHTLWEWLNAASEYKSVLIVPAKFLFNKTHAKPCARKGPAKLYGDFHKSTWLSGRFANVPYFSSMDEFKAWCSPMDVVSLSDIVNQQDQTQ